ncbi:MAG: glycosyltransferase family 2 protein [Actinobacteria bacterium]|nr:glycosyltransferase family 2 protein [Actinomycetota bacterium]
MINNNYFKNNDYSKVAILIPAYNEGKYIKAVINKCINYNLDIIIINDGSTDNTNEILKEFKSENKIIVINHDINKGKGEALKTGFNYIINNNYSGVITIDADGQHDTNEIQNFLNEIKNNNPDLIIGSRFQNTKGMPFIRKFVNFFTSWIISSIAGKKIEDVQSGFRYINRDVLKNIKLETKNFDTEPELILKAGWLNYDIKNIPIKTIYYPGEIKSHVNPVIDTIKFFKLVFRSIGWKRKLLKELKNQKTLN